MENFPLQNLSDQDLETLSFLQKQIMQDGKVSKRLHLVDVFGYDVKFSYHVIRLLSEIEEILTDHNLTLDRSDRREMLKSIRRGEWTLPQIREWFTQKEKELDALYQKSTLRHSPDEAAIKQLLLNVLESHYGSLDKAIVVSDDVSLRNALRDISDTVSKYKKLIPE